MPPKSFQAWNTGMWRLPVVGGWPILAISIALQVLLALPFGHAYDMRIFMATGYLTAAGQNPYISQDLTSIFNNSLFQGMTSIGYPPLWPLILGSIYQLSYKITPNLLLYNLAIKVPILAANIGIAFLVVRILRDFNAGEAAVRRAWNFMLLNPCILYFSAAWGQIDALVAFFALYSLSLLYKGKSSGAAVALAIAMAIKPTALPILVAALLFLVKKSARQAAVYLLLFLTAMIAFVAVLFFLFGWDPAPILRGWNAHFTVGGGMSFMTFWEGVKDTYQISGAWWLVGLLWMPVMIAFGVRIYRDRMDGFEDLLLKSTGLTLVFFLTRTWLSEPNSLLILPMILILTSIGKLNRFALTAVWALPLIFTIFNLSPPQLLFPISPGLMNNLLLLLDGFRDARLAARTAVVLPWLAAGWWIVRACFRSDGLQREPAWR